ncbi:stage II sporulation protein M [Kineosporia sp. J2-2]|uniref:Stage II sporulation protein M n=1 Tax=Kineosporia corallincola TaxID=2835133 RepID=A0ABS5TIU9_9ACTN|nr:stage II sporulation protein M [Kineosporia corallincola]MBT0770324.1 stage II sporulation protein M [Kineosporia corallincola]
MDLDAFVAVHSADWDRLDRLTRRRRLTGAEVDELVLLYQRAATHLSVVRSFSPDPALVARLSGTVARARTAVSGGNEPLTREFVRMVTVSFPAAVYRSRWWAFGSAAGSALVALALGWWVATSPRVQATVGTEQQIRQLVNNDFESYYSENAASGFAAQVWTNNAWVAALCFVLGITGVGVVFVLAQNALNLGLVGGLMAANDRLGLFFGLITPHGLLELTAVFVAAGAGLKVFWAWVDPGPRSRVRAVGEEGRAMVTIAIGLVAVLLVSGVVEAFVTPSPLPTWARITIGATVWLGFLGYVRYFGRPAALAGETGDLAAELAGDVRPVAG